MKKMYMLEDLDCANCAAKMEEAISKIDGVTYARVSYLAQKLTLRSAVTEIPTRSSPWRPMTPATMTSWPKW